MELLILLFGIGIGVWLAWRAILVISVLFSDWS